MNHYRQYYDVYDYETGELLYQELDAGRIAELLDVPQAAIYQAKQHKGLLRGKYHITASREHPQEFTHAQVLQKFGQKNYNEWCEMNRRYGHIEPK